VTPFGLEYCVSLSRGQKKRERNQNSTRSGVGWGSGAQILNLRNTSLFHDKGVIISRPLWAKIDLGAGTRLTFIYFSNSVSFTAEEVNAVHFKLC
jgi:hypothetical protein